jgi:HD superfamily phosphohydrolase
MPKKILSPKVVVDPIYGIIDIRPVLAMVETEEFQALGDKRQLGMSHIVFPSATHTRKAHSLGAYHATRKLADRWIDYGFITPREGDALAGYALYHDIGHPAFSHVTEPLCPMPSGIHGMSVNAALSLAIIRKRRKEIEACGIDFKLMESMARYANPLYLAVSDKNLGMEKLDYLERDGLCTILSRPVGVDYLREHIYFINGKLVIDEKVADNAIEVQDFYLKMYKNVYLRKASAIAQRMFQKMTHHLIQAGEIAAADLVNLTDSELSGIMRFSKDVRVRAMYKLWKTRHLYREAIVIRPQRFTNADMKAQKAKGIAVFGASKAVLARLARKPELQIENQTGLAALEAKIAKLAGIPVGYVLVTPITSTARFEAKDILIYQGPGKKPASMKARYPAHFKNIEEVAEDYVTFRVCTTDEYRTKLSAPGVARKVFKMLVK